jgi:DNA-binding CsgD family transcriptional regulator
MEDLPAGEVLDRAMQFLTQKEKALLELWRQGLRPREIALAMGWTAATVWTRRSELKNKLRAILTSIQSETSCE